MSGPWHQLQLLVQKGLSSPCRFREHLLLQGSGPSVTGASCWDAGNNPLPPSYPPPSVLLQNCRFAERQHLCGARCPACKKQAIWFSFKRKTTLIPLSTATTPVHLHFHIHLAFSHPSEKSEMVSHHKYLTLPGSTRIQVLLLLSPPGAAQGTAVSLFPAPPMIHTWKFSTNLLFPSPLGLIY